MCFTKILHHHHFRCYSCPLVYSLEVVHRATTANPADSFVYHCIKAIPTRSFVHPWPRLCFPSRMFARSTLADCTVRQSHPLASGWRTLHRTGFELRGSCDGAVTAISLGITIVSWVVETSCSKSVGWSLLSLNLSIFQKIRGGLRDSGGGLWFSYSSWVGVSGLVSGCRSVAWEARCWATLAVSKLRSRFARTNLHSRPDHSNLHSTKVAFSAQA